MRNAAWLAALMIWLSPASPAMAGDYFFGCVQPGGGYLVEDGEKRLEIFHTKPGDPLEKDGKALNYKLIDKTTIRDAEGYCLAENGTKYGWSLHTYLYQVEIPTEDQPIRLTFLCEQSGSGLPAAINECKDVTTKDKRLQPAYKDVAKR